MKRTLQLVTITTLFTLGFCCGQSEAKEAAASAEETTPLKTGEKVPEGNLFDADGKEVPLKEIHSKEPTVLVYYRGDWCRYCNQHLRNLKNIEDDLANLGYTLFAVSADKPEILNRTEEKEDLPYQLLSDSTMEVAKNLGIAFKVSDETIEKYKGYKIDLEAASGHDHHLLPVPAVFLIDVDGSILWTYTNPDYTKRLNSAELLKVARENSKK